MQEYLPACLESLCNQTCEDIEILCVDDGSTDSSLAIAYQFAERDSRIQVIPSLHKGVSSARNIGLRHARAEYVHFIDADDYVEPTIAQRMLDALDTYDVDCVMCGLQVRYEAGQEYRDRAAIEQYYRKTLSGVYPIDVQIMAYTLSSVGVKVMRRSLLEKYGIRFIEGRTYEDNFFTLAYLAIAHTICFIPDTLYVRRFRNDSITDRAAKGSSELRIDIFYQLEEVFRFWRRVGRYRDVYVVYFWNRYIVELYEVVHALNQKYHRELYDVVAPFISKYQYSIPDIPELEQCRLFLEDYLKAYAP